MNIKHNKKNVPDYNSGMDIVEQTALLVALLGQAFIIYLFFRLIGEYAWWICLGSSVSITTAILGGEIEVPTIEGKKARLAIPPGTQSQTQFRLRGKGMSVIRQKHRGDMYIETSVEIPVNLTSKQKSILREFEKEGGISKVHSPKSQSFFKKIKEVWDDLT